MKHIVEAGAVISALSWASLLLGTLLRGESVPPVFVFLLTLSTAGGIAAAVWICRGCEK